MSVPGLQDAICESGTDTFFERFRFSFVLGLPLSCDFAFRLSLCHQQGHSRGLPVDYRTQKDADTPPVTRDSGLNRHGSLPLPGGDCISLPSER